LIGWEEMSDDEGMQKLDDRGSFRDVLALVGFEISPRDGQERLLNRQLPEISIDTGFEGHFGRRRQTMPRPTDYDLRQRFKVFKQTRVEPGKIKTVHDWML
jgi:hypothetical protein